MRLNADYSLGAALAGAVLLAGLGFSLAVNLPGHLSYDSVIQLLEGRTGAYANWHPPVMSWLLGVTDAIVPGTALFVVFDTLLLFVSLLSLLLLQPRARWWAVAAALVCALCPQFLIYPGIVWKDVLFANAAVAGFVCLAQAAAWWPKVSLRCALIAAAFLLLVLASLARQNGAVVLPAGAIALAWIAASNASAKRFSSASIYVTGALVGTVLVMTGAMVALGTHIVGTSGPARQILLLQEYDIIGMVTADPKLPLKEIGDDDSDLEKLIRTIGVRVYSPERNDTLTNSQVLTTALNNADMPVVAAQWRDLIADNPWLYLKVRADVFRWVFLTPDLKMCLPFLVGISGPPQQMTRLGLNQRWDGRDDALQAYGDFFVGTPVLSHLFFAVIALALLAFLLWRRRTPDIAMAFLLLAAIGFTLTFFVISLACDYRYLYFLDIATLTAGFYVSLSSSPGNAPVEGFSPGME